jgi:osmotically-inducible protein OsmY
LRQLLAKDPRTNLLDVDVRVVGNRVFLTGTVESSVIRAAAEEVVRGAIPPEMEVVNNIGVTTYVP